MAHKTLKKLARDPKYISGIYNYCDRWCERCPFTSRCLNHTLAEEKFGDLKEKDALNEAFWQRLSGVFQDTLCLLKEMAEEQGIDLNQADQEMNGQGERMRREKALGHLLFHTSEKYAQAVEEWFRSHEFLFHEKEEELNRIRLLSSKKDPSEEALSINETTEIIRWYQFQICVKLKRAIESASEEESETHDFPKDSDGSAKVALIGIERSISAWTLFLSFFPDQKKEILGLIRSLENIKGRLEMEFPRARAFARPGFDDPKECGASGNPGER